MPRRIRQIRTEGNIAYVQLSRGYEAVIDAADIPLVSGWNWSALVARSGVYAVRNERQPSGKSRLVLMHRVIAAAGVGDIVDHMDVNTMNNTRGNLRKCTSAQNSHNQKLPRHNTSGRKGVSFNRKRRCWQAYITLARRKIHLGYHGTLESAHAAYCEASVRLHGEFGRTE